MCTTYYKFAKSRRGVSFNVLLWVCLEVLLKMPMQVVQRCCLVMEVGGPIKRKTIEHKCVKALAMFQYTNVKKAIEHNNK